MRRTLARAVGTATLLIVVLLAAGFTTHRVWAPGMLVAAPSPDGLPAPRPDDVRHALEVVRGPSTVRAWVFDPVRAPRGTVLLLHGIRDSKLNLVDAARRHAARGLRAVAVDSRGHGESTGRYLTYGVEESLDLAALVDQLERRGLLVRPLSVVGTSYGAATALLYAAIDPRAERIVALAPFASLRQVVRSYLDWILMAPARLIPSAVVDELIDESAREAGFDADHACPRCAADKIRAAVLLVHSRGDERIPWQHSVEIKKALKTRSELLLVDRVSHVDVGSGAGVEPAIHRWLAMP